VNFPYERYNTLAGAALIAYYPAGEEAYAQWVNQAVGKAVDQLSRLFGQAAPRLQLLIVAADDWGAAPHDDEEELSAPYPYFTDATSPPTVVVPVVSDATFDSLMREKLAFALYHELTLAFLEDDPRPWPEDYPLWADEWQIKFVALWLAHTLDNQQGIVNKDLYEEYIEAFEPEVDGKTLFTIREFEWYEDTEPEDYLCFEVLLEQFAANLLEKYDINIVLRFLDRYRAGHKSLSNDDVTAMLADALGPDGQEWLKRLPYF
jgi:hypothetical protein